VDEAVTRFWAGRRVAVTGASGFLGAWLTSALAGAGASVTVLLRDRDLPAWARPDGGWKDLATVRGRLEELDTVERVVAGSGADTVFHLGAQAIVGTALHSPLATFESNIRGTWNVLEVCRRHATRLRAVVVASSDKAYGDREELPYTEDAPPLGRHPYDVSKSCADLIAVAYHRTYGLPVVVARCGNLYGGGDLHFSRIVPGTVRSLLAGERPVVRSDGTPRRDYLYVRDGVDAYLRMAETAPRVAGEAFNFGPSSPLTVLQMVAAIARRIGREDLAPVVLGEACNEIRDQYLCSDKAAALLGWRPRHTLDQGLDETIAWYREHFRMDSR
jgi:CDP-glucose 4,6-dehydratase